VVLLPMINLNKIRLPIESIPNSSWGLSLANRLEKEQWDVLRKLCYKEAGHKCKVCGAENVELHCHEVWAFNDKSCLQTLKALVCVCSVCHDCIHYFRSTQLYSPKYIAQLRNHLMKLNGWNFVQLDEYLELIRKQNHKRANRRYKVIVGNRELM